MMQTRFCLSSAAAKYGVSHTQAVRVAARSPPKENPVIMEERYLHAINYHHTLTCEDNALLFVEQVNNEANWELVTLSSNACE